MLDSINQLLTNINKMPKADGLDNIFDSAKKLAFENLNTMRYLKNYIGDLERGGKTTKNYRFYDEREWRYVTPWDNEQVEPFLSEENYKKYRGNKKSTKPLIPNFHLNFTSRDIKYLIVKSAKDIPKLIRFIGQANNLTQNPDEADILATKILTVEQLNNDF